MSEWKEYRLGDVGLLQRGRSRHRPRYAFHLYGGKYPFIQTGEIREAQKYIKHYNQTYSEAGLEQSKLWPSGTLCITIAANIAELAILSFDACFPDSVLGFIPDPEKANLDFVYYTLTHFQKELKHIGEGSVQDNINLGTFEDVLFPFPSLPEQRAISLVLSSLDDKIDLLYRQNKTLEAMAETLFRQWFVEEADEGWEIQPLGKYVVIKRGSSPRPIHDFISDSGYRWLKISDVTSLNSPFVFEIQECIKEEGLQKTVFLKNGSLVLSNSATPGIPKILAVDFCIHDGWLYFPQSYFSKEFLYLLFKHIRPQLVLHGNGSIFTNLKTDILKEFEIPIPDQRTLEEFDNLIKPIFNKLFLNSQQIRTLEKLRDTLLPKLMSGEVRVNI